MRVFADHVEAETDYELDRRTQVPMDAVRGWRIEPCDFDAVCVEFVTADTTYRVLLDTSDETVAALALRRVLGEPLPSEPEGAGAASSDNGSANDTGTEDAQPAQA